MRKKIFSVLFICFLLHVPGVAFAHSAAIKVSGGNRYKAVRLTPQIYNAANEDLSDILIKDGAGGDVPYFIHTGFKNINASKETYPMELIDAYIKDDRFFFDYRLAAGRNSDAIATAIEFTSQNADFVKSVDIYGSYDNVHWEFVQSDKLYSVDGIQKLTVEFIRPEKYTHYRFKLTNNLERISFDAVDLIYNTEISDEVYFIESLVPEFTVESAGQRTNVMIGGLKNLRLHDITVHSDSMFKRTAGAPQGVSREIYNLSLYGTSYSNTTIPLNGQISQDETYVITIFDYDDQPIKINGITIRYYADEIVFEGGAGEAYTLEFGADPAKAAPVYDIVRYKNEILKGTLDRAALGEIHYSAVEAPPPERNYKALFNVVVVCIALLLGVVILLKLRERNE
jgi:hypothetical protein